ncbi:MAG: hypothetical protein JW778_03495 [Candidatus Altiarchaeota archaeon]|nr:hypothetical protein [Candidatus Altiarchaeota archaeon]
MLYSADFVIKAYNSKTYRIETPIQFWQGAEEREHTRVNITIEFEVNGENKKYKIPVDTYFLG